MRLRFVGEWEDYEEDEEGGVTEGIVTRGGRRRKEGKVTEAMKKGEDVGTRDRREK